MRLKKKDRPTIDPFAFQDAETLIAAIHRDWGETQGNYDELRFFTGMRPSEEIALTLSDLDVVHGVVSVWRRERDYSALRASPLRGRPPGVSATDSS
jgi:integrase